MKNHSDHYYFRLEMEPNVFKATFNTNPSDSPDVRNTVKINVKVMEGTTVNLSCSAEAPCPKQPPTISWSNIPESAHITTQLQMNSDKTQSVISHVTFKASYINHRKNISCTATYTRHALDDSSANSTVMLQVYKITGISDGKEQGGHSMLLIAGCVGAIVAVLMFSVIGICTRMRMKTHRGDNFGERNSLNQAQNETIERNCTYAAVVIVTNQDNKISDEQSVRDCNTKFSAQINHKTEKDSTEEDNNKKGSDVVYAQIQVFNKKTKAISVRPEDIYAQDQGDSMEDAIAASKAHFAPRRNIVAERHAFRKCVQAPGETIIQYVAALWDLPTQVQLVENVSSHRICERLLLESELTLEKAITIATQIEAAGEQAKLLSVNVQGIQPDEDHLSAILHAPAPKDAPQLRSFIGLLSWYNNFIPNFATEIEPLPACIRQGSDFVWSEEAQQCFDAVKKLLVQSPVLALFNPNLPTVVSTDASNYGLGAVHAQVHENGTERIVAFALSSAERNSAIGRESLACVWAVEKWQTCGVVNSSSAQTIRR
ncbi:hypothetical protein QQF64_022125 [Cirrhinus molitorella]|uniref:Ig-like domain-containing protein n=1 Tax=Cirrhinus molitorella TaxID=172907 RepID=A0ABR3L7F1_9TELE